ncbi:MAG: Crp/Fnr family transcriptional regulator [Candidatus Acidiferrum sp.]|jgi:CRP-like cAMP-binding protein
MTSKIAKATRVRDHGQHRGVRSAGKGQAVTNEALLAMPDAEWKLLVPKLRYVELPDHLVLHKPHETLKFLYFPNSGLISLVVFMEDGKTVEAGVVGREGIVGLPGVMGFPRHPLQEIVQVSGDGFRVSVQAFRKLAPRLAEFQLRATRYIMSLGLQVAQTAACNRVHGLEQRLARWLLMAQDRVRADSLAITQDFLATMMGTDRPSVTLAERLLTRAGAIEHTRGAVRIINREQLECSTCECYGVIAQYAAAVADGRIPAAVRRARGPAMAEESKSAPDPAPIVDSGCRVRRDESPA